MKSFITPTYTFTPGASGVGTVDLSGIPSFEIKSLVAIINQTRGVVIYSTADTAKRFTNVAGTVITLFFDTSTHSNTDVLQIIYDHQTSGRTHTTDLPTGSVLMGVEEYSNDMPSGVLKSLTTPDGVRLDTRMGTTRTFFDNINSSTSPLSANDTFYGDWTEVSDFGSVKVTIYADMDSAFEGVVVKFQ